MRIRKLPPIGQTFFWLISFLFAEMINFGPKILERIVFWIKIKNFIDLFNNVSYHIWDGSTGEKGFLNSFGYMSATVYVESENNLLNALNSFYWKTF